MPSCWKCSAPLPDLPALLPFRATCDQCGAWLHCCVNCTHYAPGKPNDCEVPDTDPIRDREGANFCEEFHLAGVYQEKKVDLDQISKNLFKDE